MGPPTCKPPNPASCVKLEFVAGRVEDFGVTQEVVELAPNTWLRAALLLGDYQHAVLELPPPPPPPPKHIP